MKKIPKIIHYCWFGENEKSDLAKKCIDSWKKILPEYKIIEWNEENFNIYSNLYVKQAYDAKKYAFVSDYVRLYALYNYGGIYMDTDVEVIKTLDKFLDYDAFMGFEDDYFCGTGIIGSKKRHLTIKQFLDMYNNLKFINEDGSYNTTTNVYMITNTLQKYNIQLNNKQQNVKDIEIFPKTVFSPLSFNSDKTDFSETTHTIHHFEGSWLSDKSKKKLKQQKKINKIRAILCKYMSERSVSIILDFKWIIRNKLYKIIKYK